MKLAIYKYSDDGDRIHQSFNDFDQLANESDEDYQARAIAHVQNLKKQADIWDDISLYHYEEIEVPKPPKLSPEELAKIEAELTEIDSKVADTHQQIREASKPLQAVLRDLENRQDDLRTILRENR